jgi:hypothetical protein
LDTFILHNQVRLGISQALLLLYRYLTGIYALGDLSFVQFLAGYVGGQKRSLKECRILTISGNGIGELEKNLCLQWKLTGLETMTVSPGQMRIIRFLMEVSPEEANQFFEWARGSLNEYPNLQSLLASPGLAAYWQQQCELWQSSELAGRTRLFSGSPWTLKETEHYDIILLSHAQKLLFVSDGRNLLSLLKPRGILAALMPVTFCPRELSGLVPARFSDLPVVQSAKERMWNEARRLGYERSQDLPGKIHWKPASGNIVQYVSFSIASPLRSLLIGELLIESLAADLPNHIRLALLNSALEQVPPSAGAGTETLLILLAEKEAP